MLLQHPQSSSRSVAEHTQLMMVGLPLSLSLSPCPCSVRMSHLAWSAGRVGYAKYSMVGDIGDAYAYCGVMSLLAHVQRPASVPRTHVLQCASLVPMPHAYACSILRHGWSGRHAKACLGSSGSNGCRRV